MPDQDSSSSEMYSLGDISEADERVKKFYGLIPKSGPMEIKTVRMVKRDSKERSEFVTEFVIQCAVQHIL